jgi:aspartyl protease family protein
MSTRLIRDALIFSSISLGGFYAFTHRPMLYELIGISPQDIVDARDARMRQEQKDALPVANTVNTQRRNRQGSVTIHKSSDGQFWANAQVNKSEVRFLVDTGASIVALTPEDARNAGFNLRHLSYTSRINTASGEILAAPVLLQNVAIGNVSVRDVRAVVIPEGLTHSLLGMSFLGELQKIEASRDVLLLKR